MKRIVNNDALENFYAGMEYDSMDRVSKLIYPDQSYISYSYNNRGLLESVPNVIDSYDYNPAGQNALLKLACGTATTYAYDSRLRLSRLKTVRSKDSLALQDLTYTYDTVSDITEITDNRGNPVLDAIGAELGIPSDTARKFNATQSFVYDSLYRLTQAANSTIYGAISYRYDRIGNMVSKNASLIVPDPLMDLGAMSSGGRVGTQNRVGRNAGDDPGPHAITGTQKGADGPMSFTYDDNGNMTTDRGMALSWDYKDRLVALTEGTKTASYIYDYTDTRKKKSVSNSADGSKTEALYIDKFCEIRDGKLMKYVYAGTSRIARAEGIADSAAALMPSAFYLHDHLGSTAMSLSGNAEVTEQMVNYPYGSPRLEHQKLARTDYRFTGKERDKESGLQYFEARYYYSLRNCFISTDTLVCLDDLNRLIKSSQSLNPYSYSLNKPLNYVDKDGKLAHIVIGAAIGAAINTAIYCATSDNISVGSIVGVAASGAITGAVSAATFGAGAAVGFLGGVSANLAAGAIGETVNQASQAVEAKLTGKNFG